jgi:hypothetical protein
MDDESIGPRRRDRAEVVRGCLHARDRLVPASFEYGRGLSKRTERVKDTSECQKPMRSVRGTRLLSCQASWELQRVAGRVHRAKEPGNAAVGRELVILPWHNLGCARTGLIGVAAAGPGSAAPRIVILQINAFKVL